MYSEKLYMTWTVDMTVVLYTKVLLLDGVKYVVKFDTGCSTEHKFYVYTSKMLSCGVLAKFIGPSIDIT